MSLSLLLADGELLFRRAVREVLSTEEFSVAGEASDGPEAIQLAATLQPDVAVLSAYLPVLNGLDAGKEIRRVTTKTGIVLMAAQLGTGYVRTALSAGISGFVSRAGDVANLQSVIRRVASGSIYQDPLLFAHTERDEPENGNRCDIQLTGRERQIVQLIAECRTTKEIADLLKISTKTAESHRQRAMAKLNVDVPAQLVRYAIRNSLVEVRIPPPQCRVGEEDFWPDSLTRSA